MGDIRCNPNKNRRAGVGSRRRFASLVHCIRRVTSSKMVSSPAGPTIAGSIYASPSVRPERIVLEIDGSRPGLGC